MSYPETRCFLVEPAAMVAIELRRYRMSTSGDSCPGRMGYHDASVQIGEETIRIDERGRQKISKDVARDDPRWPRACGCGYVFTDADEWQVNEHRLYVSRKPDFNSDIKEGRWTVHNLPPGAMFYPDWLQPEEGEWRFYEPGPDGKVLAVICPNGRQWIIDSEASNCTRKGDRTHHCWIRHGVPPLITVDKNGNTCQAGAGSIQAGDYHGFLRNGVLTAG